MLQFNFLMMEKKFLNQYFIQLLIFPKILQMYVIIAKKKMLYFRP